MGKKKERLLSRRHLSDRAGLVVRLEHGQFIRNAEDLDVDGCHVEMRKRSTKPGHKFLAQAATSNKTQGVARAAIRVLPLPLAWASRVRSPKSRTVAAVN